MFPDGEIHSLKCVSLKEVHINPFDNYLNACVLGILLGANNSVVKKMFQCQWRGQEGRASNM